MTVTLFEPKKIGREEWRCIFRITGLGKPIETYATGDDSLHALTIAIEGARVHLERYGDSLTWFGGEVGEHGLPRPVPSGFGVKVERHLARLVEEEVTRLVVAKRKRAARKLTARAKVRRA